MYMSISKFRGGLGLHLVLFLIVKLDYLGSLACHTTFVASTVMVDDIQLAYALLQSYRKVKFAYIVLASYIVSWVSIKLMRRVV